MFAPFDPRCPRLHHTANTTGRSMRMYMYISDVQSATYKIIQGNRVFCQQRPAGPHAVRSTCACVFSKEAVIEHQNASVHHSTHVCSALLDSDSGPAYCPAYNWTKSTCTFSKRLMRILRGTTQDWLISCYFAGVMGDFAHSMSDRLTFGFNRSFF